MMKPVLTLLIILAAGPALAHPDAHVHTHANDAIWLALVLSGLIGAGAARLAWARTK